MHYFCGHQKKISKLHFWEDFKSTVHVVVFPKSATKAHMLPLGLVHCLWPHTRVDRDHVRLLKLHLIKEFAIGNFLMVEILNNGSTTKVALLYFHTTL